MTHRKKGKLKERMSECVCVLWRRYKLPEAKPGVKMAGPENSLLLGKQDKTTSPNE